MMKMTAHIVVCVIAVWNRRMAAAGSVNMCRLVPAAAMANSPRLVDRLKKQARRRRGDRLRSVPQAPERVSR
jgi:hypothetical protein